jgi:hypothetical protein
VQEEGFPTRGTERSAEWRGVAQRRSAQAKRGRLGCLLSRARDGVPQRAWLSCISLNRRDGFGRCSSGQALRTGKARRGLWWKTPRPLERTKRRQACRGAGQTTCQQPVRPPTTCCRDLRLLRNCWPKWSVATASSGLATMGVDVLLKGESCLLRFQTSLGRDFPKVQVFLFRRGSHSPTQLLQGLGERSCSVLVFSY